MTPYLSRWIPTNFKAEYPSPEDRCIFCLGGPLHGEILQYDLGTFPPKTIRVPEIMPRSYVGVDPLTPDLPAMRSVEYMLEEIWMGSAGYKLLFYRVERVPFAQCLVKAFTDLHYFKKEAAQRL
jgi:hypothetical protein